MRRRATGIRYVWLVCGTAVLALDIVASSASGRRGLGYAALRPSRSSSISAPAWAADVSPDPGGRPGRRGNGPGGRHVGLGNGALATALVALATIATGFGIGLVGGALGKVGHSRMADLSDS
ncbi:MAG TPA: hypothetical protein VJ277_03570 [Gemmatimonadales bacterium]|nr:hypothetical protein [Gemmatimonadales bacterium]